MVDLAEVVFDNIEKDWDEISLTKLLKTQVKDIVVTVSQEVGDFVLKIRYISFENGAKLYVEGEHDIAYLANYSSKDDILPSDKILQDLNKQQTKAMNRHYGWEDNDEEEE